MHRQFNVNVFVVLTLIIGCTSSQMVHRPDASAPQRVRTLSEMNRDTATSVVMIPATDARLRPLIEVRSQMCRDTPRGAASDQGQEILVRFDAPTPGAYYVHALTDVNLAGRDRQFRTLDAVGLRVTAPGSVSCYFTVSRDALQAVHVTRPESRPCDPNDPTCRGTGSKCLSTSRRWSPSMARLSRTANTASSTARPSPPCSAEMSRRST